MEPGFVVGHLSGARIELAIYSNFVVATSITTRPDIDSLVLFSAEVREVLEAVIEKIIYYLCI